MADLEDEIIIRDPTGKFKILRGGKLYDLAEKTAGGKAAAPVSKLAEEVLKKSGLVLTENLKERFGDIVEAYFRDVRDKFETKSILAQETNRGGVGFSSEQADLVIKLIKEKAASETDVVVQKTLPRAGIIPKREQKAAAPKLKMPELPPGVAEFVFSRADEAEILAAKQKLPKTMAGMKPIEVAKIIKEIMEECGLSSLSEEPRKKLENILLTNLKDIRDGFETRETLSGLVGSAGINLTGEQLEKILSVTRQKLQKLEEKTRSLELQKIKIAMEEQKIRSGEIKEETVGGVKEKMNERWQEITQKETLTPMVLPEELVAPSAGVQLRARGEFPKISIVPGRLPISEPTPFAVSKNVSPKTMTPAPSSAKAGMPPPEAPEEERPKPLQIFKPIVPSQVRRPTPLRDNRPRLDDVKYVPKLVGPVEELQEMTPTDWRRLGANPAAAAAKIKEKIGLLEREAFAKKIAGIKAWQASEVNKIYLEIGRESLQKGVSFDKIIAERTSVGKPTLTSEEYLAIMELNRALRY